MRLKNVAPCCDYLPDGSKGADSLSRLISSANKPRSHLVCVISTANSLRLLKSSVCAICK